MTYTGDTATVAEAHAGRLAKSLTNRELVALARENVACQRQAGYGTPELAHLQGTGSGLSGEMRSRIDRAGMFDAFVTFGYGLTDTELGGPFVEVYAAFLAKVDLPGGGL